MDQSLTMALRDAGLRWPDTRRGGPSLDDLLQAIPRTARGFLLRCKGANAWNARWWYDICLEADGATPLEATARLWLALHHRGYAD
ncbi:hypothetical protein [Hyphomicrobium sp. CS1BSMeth3]|uniref:hypothetical protein n=1 Tax=Hyphomicrobium sp. CS1BSMeth3 TaxID=1892844 RepID=UPI000930E2AB|nr:hypothetical protein [Hyphomicrobium sp. CS1BSMeth3]